MKKGESTYSWTQYVYDGKRLVMKAVNSEEYGYKVYYQYNEQGRIDTSLESSAEPRRSIWYYNAKGQVDSIEGYTVYDYENPNDWQKVETQSYTYGKKNLTIKEAFCSQYSGCKMHSYEYKKKAKILDVVSGSDAEMHRTIFTYRKKLLIKKEKIVSEDMKDYDDDETFLYTYTYY